MATGRSTDHQRLDPRVERTRQAALAAALELLVQEGWDALTHVRLAAASRVSRMTLYRHWPTRLDLLHDTLQEAAHVRHATVSGDLRRDLMKELQLIRTQLLDRARGRLLATLIQQAQSDAQIARLRDESVGEGVSGVARILEAGKSAGALPADLDVEAAITWLVGPLVYRLLVNGKRLSPAFVDEVAENFLARYTQAGRARRATSNGQTD